MQDKKRMKMVLSGLALVAIAAIAFMAGAATTTPPLPMDPIYLTRVANRTPTAGDGIPAIRPHLSGNGPTFTAADARAYVTTNGIGRVAIQGPINVTLVVFGSAAQIQGSYAHVDLGVGSDRLICYVEIQNTITIANPAGRTLTYSHGFAIFDAHTGNLLGDGAFN